MKHQRGMSFFGLLFMLAILGGIVTIGLKILPPYMDFITVTDAIDQVFNQPRMALTRLEDIEKRIDTTVSVNNIHIADLGPRAMTLGRHDGVLRAELDYIVTRPVYKNDDVEMEITLHFTKVIEKSAAE